MFPSSLDGTISGICARIDAGRQVEVGNALRIDGLIFARVVVVVLRNQADFFLGKRSQQPAQKGGLARGTAARDTNDERMLHDVGKRPVLAGPTLQK